MIELTPQSEAEKIAALSGWIIYEQSFLAMLTDAGCSAAEAAVCMRELN
jgi:hypothetical protein